MNLSILILTHNRPELFKRCLNSVIDIVPQGVEILVNNDSKDIEEISHPQVKYYYDDIGLGNIYKSLFDKSTKDNIYYLEDDDYIMPTFFDKIDLSYDLNYMNFVNVNLNEFKIKEFCIEKENYLFQLSQILFKKSLCTSFPLSDHIHNDWVLFQNLMKQNPTVKLIKTPMFVQTQDGKDNISF